MLSTDYHEKFKEEEQVKRPRRGVRTNKKSRGLDLKALDAIDTDCATPKQSSSEEE